MIPPLLLLRDAAAWLRKQTSEKPVEAARPEERQTDFLRMKSIRFRIEKKVRAWSLLDVRFLMNRIDRLEAELTELEDGGTTRPSITRKNSTRQGKP